MRVVLIAILFALALPSVSHAHGGGSDHGWVSTVERIIDANGVEAEASGDGHFTFTAPAGKTVVVYGYGSEPYLRFANGKVYENRLSASAYVNRDEAPPANDVGAVAPPRWQKVADGRTYTWHDHRTHWMASKKPPAVERNPGARHHVRDWVVSGTADGRRFAIAGSLDWAPTESGLGWQWLLVPLIAGAAVYAFFLTFVTARRRRVPAA